MLKSSYIYKNSLIHKLNSILKIIDILIIMLSILCINKITDMIIISIYLLLVILLTKINIINYLKKVFKLKILILFIIIINLLLKSSTINITYLVVKVILLVINSSILMFTTKEKDITYSLEILLSPLKKILPIKEMALSISLSLIFIPLVIEESKNIIDAEASRGIDFYNENLLKKLESIMILFTPMFILSLKRADTITDIMSIRLYQGSRSYYQFKSISILDIVILLINVIIFLVVWR